MVKYIVLATLAWVRGYIYVDTYRRYHCWDTSCSVSGPMSTRVALCRDNGWKPYLFKKHHDGVITRLWKTHEEE